MSDDNNKPEMKEVDFRGVKALLPVEQADAFIAARDEQAKAYNELKAQIDAKAAAEQSAAERAKQEEERRIALEAAQKGQVDQLENHFKSQLHEKERLLLKVSVKAELSANKNLVSAAVPDVTAMLANDPGVVLEGGNLMHKGPDGTLKPFNQFVDEWIESKPYFQASKIPARQSGDGQPKIPADVEVITTEEWRAHPKKYAALAAQNKLIVKEE